ncbi:MAG: hypothetical protein KDA68_12525, partial [Planctomycetaceae bacterium]|nr:hypothetical protein [Planctomycetaceae bacterium]
AEEREQGTLGLLKMTGVSRLAILWGKSTSWLLITCGFLLLQLPFVSLAVTMGGVSLNQVVAATISIGAFAVLLCNFALFCSLICRTTRGASFTTAFGIGTYLFVPRVVAPILGMIISVNPANPITQCLIPVRDLLSWFSETSIISRLRVIQQTGFGGSLISYQVVSNLIGGAFFFGLSWIFFERLTRNLDPVEARPSLLILRLNFWSKQPKQRPSLQVWKNPFLWQEYHFVRGGNTHWYRRWLASPVLTALVLVFIYGINWRIAVSGFGTPWFPNRNELLVIITGITFWSSLFFWVAESLLGSSRVLGDEYREGTLSMLLLLPKSIRRIVGLKILGEGIALIPYLFWVVSSGVAMIYVYAPVLKNFANVFREGEPLLDWIFGTFTMIAGYVLLYQIILWYSVHVKRGALGLGFVTFHFGYAVFSIGFLTAGLLLDNYFGLRLDERTMTVLMYSLTAGFLLFFNIAFHISTFRRVVRVGEISGS